MTKKCTICNKPAVYRIKDTPDFYCNDCAEENFGDVNMLVKVEEEAQKLKEYIETGVNGEVDDDEVEESAPVEGKPKKKKVSSKKDDAELDQDDV
ncbi:hypothetical protein HZC30_05705 [Candidatus Woesearchaeota archaeon]|nr:hypothetical protein [Candidatus Woesearchaeota archaeon]